MRFVSLFVSGQDRLAADKAAGGDCPQQE